MHMLALLRSISFEKYDAWIVIIFAALGSLLMVPMGIDTRLSFLYLFMGVVLSVGLKISNGMTVRYFAIREMELGKTNEKDKAALDQKINENKSRFFNAALFAIIAMFPPLLYFGLKNSDAKFDLRGIELYRIEGGMPLFDDQLREIEITNLPLMRKDNFPSFFDIHLKYANDNIRMLSKMQSVSDGPMISAVIEDYRSLTELMSNYVRLAHELQALEYEPTQANLSTRNSLKSELDPYVDNIKTGFPVLKKDYCAYIKSDEYKVVADEVAKYTGNNYKFTSGFCLNVNVSRPVNPFLLK
ncbi:hypothetical protein KHC28_24840 [Ancylobacter sonchi]|uniref:hypothetical protein n=1 Tax=Ancylobacter sonchi TaxID=1937790 RepID=UPI001BD33688|nr:hypothetical protein [Ancylobacter sonchi]MBS7536875.1 hypothetical protein [Ancylobacter sonchi]